MFEKLSLQALFVLFFNMSNEENPIELDTKI